MVINDISRNEALDREALITINGGRWKWLVRAFKAGYKAGKYLDRKFALSDRIAGTGKYWR